MTRPLVLFTNDDGINSPGLWAAVEAFADVADILVAAPRNQQSGTGRSMPATSTGEITPVEGKPFAAYAVDGSPAQAVQHGVLEIAARKPSLIVSGINYGENTGNGVTISGTVGAAIEAASLGIPAIAVSQQTAHHLHLTYSDEVDFATAAHFTRKFGLWLLENDAGVEEGNDIDLLKLDVPVNATPSTPWRITRLSKRRVYWPTLPERNTSYSSNAMGYRMDIDPSTAEPDSDVYTVFHLGEISLTPISLDMTSRVNMADLRNDLNGVHEA